MNFSHLIPKFEDGLGLFPGSVFFYCKYFLTSVNPSQNHKMVFKPASEFNSPLKPVFLYLKLQIAGRKYEKFLKYALKSIILLKAYLRPGFLHKSDLKTLISLKNFKF